MARRRVRSKPHRFPLDEAAGLAFLLLFSSVSCDQGVPPPTSDTSVVYSREIQPLLNSKCANAGCHDAATAAEGLALDSWVNIFKGSDHGAAVIPFRAEKSHLIFHVNRDSTITPVANPQMPPDAPLPKDQIALLMKWINEGARNDNGDIAFANPAMGKVYVTNQAEDQVAVIDIESNLVMRIITAGTPDTRLAPPEAPHNVVVDPQGVYYFVNLIVMNEIWKFRVKDDALVAKVPLGEKTSPAQIVISADGKTGYVSNFDLLGTNRSIQVFDAQSMTVTDTVRDQRILAAHGVQLTHDGKSLWTANQLSDNIAVIDPVTKSVTAIVKADTSVSDLPTGNPRFGPYQLVFSLDDNFAYVTCNKSNEVRVFDTHTKLLVQTISVGVQPLILDITPDGKFVYVANRGSNSVSVLRTSDNTEVTRIDTVGVEPHGVAVTKDGRYVYVSCENLNNPAPPHHPLSGSKVPGFVAVIDAATNRVVKRIEVGAYAAGVSVTQ